MSSTTAFWRNICANSATWSTCSSPRILLNHTYKMRRQPLANASHNKSPRKSASHTIRESYRISANEPAKAHFQQNARCNPNTIRHPRIWRTPIRDTPEPTVETFFIKRVQNHLLSNQVKDNCSDACCIKNLLKCVWTMLYRILQPLQTIEIKNKWKQRMLSPGKGCR